MALTARLPITNPIRTLSRQFFNFRLSLPHFRTGLRRLAYRTKPLNLFTPIFLSLSEIRDPEGSKPIQKLGTINTCGFVLAHAMLFQPPAAYAFEEHVSEEIQNFKPLIADLDPSTAKLAVAFLGPFLSAFGFLFILRIVMSWYPKLPVGKFPYVIAYAPTEPLLSPTRKLIPPVGGVDVTPVVWFGLISFMNEILVGPQGLLVLLSQQV
ncbi:protein COFACTOR ASSEMBLY OF COMPLEX C SUBUNIT B CCB3, chloroplastic [Amborella trichopoda]|uniref:CCB3 n=1 Tax=Amborella trichopoda TaxID=13333 RepID=W1PQG4_AMBTC|nr:protein COFACTOR ASSEMBLY OF COMPLEX C SUBUNIT B CCB3, chloroplastic [Amborella trichopoda]ERN09460.1 hypothetical protein AMTR_s00029p00097940 [Amborella trichopoda]|eukprot:XP_006847879.1 protein COFACTOR ASSEMBLY OF COMPLEX C SUBUNIT B CCB3, chloroplastic [Amborella trichopoda]